jgi:hypothetical protein
VNVLNPSIEDVALQLSDPVKLADLLEEVSTKNHVRVVKYAAVKKPYARVIHRKVLDELSTQSAACGIGALVFYDSLRMLAGEKPVFVDEAFRRLGGDLRSVTRNLRTNVGIDFCAGQLSGVTTTQADYIALSNNTNSPAAGDSSATAPWSTASATDGAAGSGRGEWTGLGLTRKQATYAHTTSVASYTLSATWTATGASTSSQMCGLFGGSSRTAQANSANNILVLENTFTATSLATNDQLSLTWTVNI